MFSMKRMKFLTYLVMFSLVIASINVGCSKKEEPPPPKPKPPKVTHRKPAPPKPKPGPVTLQVLQLMPESAAMAYAMPPLSNIYPKTVSLAQHLAPENANVKTLVDETVKELARELKVDETLTLMDIAKAKGIDPDSPIAFFVDFAPTQESAKALTATIEGSEAKDNVEASESSDTKDAEANEENEMDDTGNVEIHKIETSQIEKVLPPAIAGVIGCVDEAVAEATLKEILAYKEIAIDTSQVKDEVFDGVTIHCIDPEIISYFTHEKKLVVSNSPDFLKKIIARFKTPAKMRYGTPECPALALDDFVSLTRVDKMAEIIEGAVPLLMAMNPMMKMAENQLKSQMGTLAALKGPDPMVSTFNFSNEKLGMIVQLDMSKHPGMVEMSGQPKPLRLPTLLPKSTLAMLSIGFNEQSKATMQESMTGAMPPGSNTPQGAMIMEQYKQFLNMIGEEICVGITGFQGPFPKVIAMVDLDDMETTKALLNMLMPGMPAEIYNDVELFKPAAPLPISISFAYIGNTLAIATDITQLKTIIDLFQSGNKSNFFASLKPPMDAATPLYSIFALKGELFSELLKTPFMEAQMAESANPGAVLGFKKAEQVLSEIRMIQGIDKNWQKSEGTITLK